MYNVLFFVHPIIVESASNGESEELTWEYSGSIADVVKSITSEFPLKRFGVVVLPCGSEKNIFVGSKQNSKDEHVTNFALFQLSTESSVRVILKGSSNNGGHTAERREVRTIVERLCKNGTR